MARGARTRRSNFEPDPTYFLGNTDGATHASDASNCHPSSSDFDTYLHNRWNSWLPSDVRDRIVITFADVPIYELEVDWQIFPVTQYGADADLTIKADGTTIFHHGLVGAAKEDGDLGHLSYAFDQPVSTLEFIDWRDAPIGIDNLWVGNTPPDEQMEAVPEPATLGLWAFGLAIGVVVSSRRRSGRS